MIAPLKQPLRSEIAQHHQATLDAAAAALRARRERRGAWLAAALGFFALMPYAAISAGNNSSIQFGNLLTIVMAVPTLLLSWRYRSLWFYPLLMAPLVIGMFKVALAGNGDLSLTFKAVLVWFVVALTIVAAQLYAPRHTLAMLTGMAVATIIHAGVGVWQWYAFDNGEFPMLWAYTTNPSFLSVEQYARTIARYTQRPFGIFPEPSAMSSSLAPWVLFWIAHLTGVIRLRQRAAAWQNALFAAAAVGGLGLIILSRSGHSAITLAAAMTFGIIWLTRCRATFRTFVVLAGVFGVIAPIVIYLAFIALSDRLFGASAMGNSSWEERSSSLVIGFSLWVDHGLIPLFFGIGPGQTTPILQRVYHLEAIWSVLLTYVYETGLIGAVVLCWLGTYLGRIWKSLRFDLTFAAITVVWLVGATVTTSYNELLSLWLTLGWLTVWPQICEPAPAKALWQPRPRLGEMIERFGAAMKSPAAQGAAADGSVAAASPS